MKRDFLKGLTFKVGENDINLPDELIDQIMKENGADIEATKSKADRTQEIENLQSQLKTNEGLLKDANAQIETFKTLDVEGIKTAADDWKSKFEVAAKEAKDKEKTFQEQLKQQSYEFTLKEAVSGLQFPNELSKNAFLNELKAKNLPLENEKLLGFEDYVKEIGERNPGLFTPVKTEPQQTQEPTVQFAAATSNGQAPQKGMSLLDAMKSANGGQNVDISQVGRFAQ